MSEVNHRRNGKKYSSTPSGHGWSKCSRRRIKFYKRENGEGKVGRRNGSSEQLRLTAYDCVTGHLIDANL